MCYDVILNHEFKLYAMNILIIEDDKVSLQMLRASIENLGHTTAIAETAEQAIDLIVDKDKDLIISDIMMPGISGLTLVNTLRLVHLCKTPIVMMSVLNNKPLLDAAFAAGADDFISKPFVLEDIKEILRKYDKSLS